MRRLCAITFLLLLGCVERMPSAEDDAGSEAWVESFEGLGNIALQGGEVFGSGVILTAPFSAPGDFGSFGPSIVDCTGEGGFFGVSCDQPDLVFPDGRGALGNANLGLYFPYIEITLPGPTDHVEIAVVETTGQGSTITIEGWNGDGELVDQTSASGLLPIDWPGNVLSLDGPEIEHVRLVGDGSSVFMFDALTWTPN